MSSPSVPDASSAPKLDPESLALRAQPQPVVRLSRRMLVLSAGLLAAALAVGLFWSLKPRRPVLMPGTELVNVERVARAESLDRLPKDYAGIEPKAKPDVPVLGPPLPGDLGPPIVKAQQPVEQRSGPASADTARLAAEDAAKSSVFFRSNSSASRVPPTPATLGTSSSTGLAATAAVPQPGMSTSDATAAQNRQDAKEAFLAKAGDAVARNPSSLQAPGSPYQVMAGTVIRAALVTGISSDLPGQVIANVTEGVYDTATGRHLLIPQGTRLVGRYDSQVAFGQRRVLLVWMRLILPDTSSIALDRLPGIDPQGYAGLEDGVDWHWDRILAGAALSTLLGIGAELAAPESRSDDNRVLIAGRESVQESVNQVGQEVTRRNVSVQPTLTIRPGFPVVVMVSKDLVMRPYQPLFFQRGSSQ